MIFVSPPTAALSTILAPLAIVSPFPIFLFLIGALAVLVSILWLRTLVPSARVLPCQAIQADPENASPDQQETLRVEKYAHATQHDALALLAGRVAHEFNERLTSILGHASILEDDLKAGRAAQMNLEEIVAAAEQARAFTQQLLAFGRPKIPCSKSVDLNIAVREASGCLQRIAGGNTLLELRLEADAGSVLGTAYRIEELLVPLVHNATEAMQSAGCGQGRILIETSEETAGSKRALLRVLDEGAGFNAECLERIFDPCFTSKDRSAVGLGLSIVKRTLEQSGGTIRVFNRPEGGACVELALQRVAEAEPRELIPMTPALPRVPRTRPRTICLVDDDDAVRRLVTVVLEGGGYRVLACSSGEEALETFTTERDTIDLLLSDVNMAPMHGPELVRRVIAQHGPQDVIFMSGFVDRKDFSKDAPLWSEFIQKPFRPGELLSCVEGVLEASLAREHVMGSRPQTSVTS